DLVREAERGLLDFVTFEDGLGLQSAQFHRPDDRTDQVRGRLDASLVAAFVAPLTTRIGIVPTTDVTHTEPFHLATVIATLDHASTQFEFAAACSDVVFLTPHDLAGVGRILSQVDDATARFGRPLRRFADLVVFLDDTPGRKTRLDSLAGSEFVSDAAVFT